MNEEIDVVIDNGDEDPDLTMNLGDTSEVSFEPGEQYFTKLISAEYNYTRPMSIILGSSLHSLFYVTHILRDQGIFLDGYLNSEYQFVQSMALFSHSYLTNVFLGSAWVFSLHTLEGIYNRYFNLSYHLLDFDLSVDRNLMANTLIKVAFTATLVASYEYVWQYLGHQNLNSRFNCNYLN